MLIILETLASCCSTTEVFTMTLMSETGLPSSYAKRSRIREYRRSSKTDPALAEVLVVLVRPVAIEKKKTQSDKNILNYLKLVSSFISEPPSKLACLCQHTTLW